jgi:hypothetical protein
MAAAPPPLQIHILETSITTWTKQIKNVLNGNPDAALKVGGRRRATWGEEGAPPPTPAPDTAPACGAPGWRSLARPWLAADGPASGAHLSLPPPLPAQVPGAHPGPLVELEFWTERAANLNSIHDQLQGEKVQKVIRVLQVGRSGWALSGQLRRRLAGDHAREGLACQEMSRVAMGMCPSVCVWGGPSAPQGCLRAAPGRVRGGKGRGEG